MNRPAGFLSDGLAPRDFVRLAEFIQQTTGIKMPPSKKTFLEGRLRKRLLALGAKSFGDYCRWLFDEGGLPEEETQLIDAVTTNKTDFFREPHHFDFLVREALPKLTVEGRGLESPLRIWSAGCSNGAEPYTIAMICQDFLVRLPRFRFEIWATDICTRMLDEAARAIYPHAESNRCRWRCANAIFCAMIKAAKCGSRRKRAAGSVSPG